MTVDFKNYNSIYFLGIGGVGMSSLAAWSLLNTFQVGGYDRQSNDLTDKLKLQGQIGYIDSKRYMLSRSIKSADLIHPKVSEPFCETKRVVKELMEIL